MAHLDYSKWNNIDTNSEPEVSVTEKSVNCTCLSVGMQKLRCHVLVLGGSQQENGCWERVGIVSGHEPAIFVMAERRI